jgi:hypothetical protein
MLDDDVTADPFCLYIFSERGTDFLDDFVFFVGCKTDVNNRRGYPDFNSRKNPASDLKPGCSFNHLYDVPICTDRLSFIAVPVRTIDTGNCFLKLTWINSRKVDFTPFEESYNCGGEDTLFAMQIAKKFAAGKTYFLPQAIGYHLEKPATNFSEFAARGEMLLRAAELLDLDKSILDEFMPYIRAKKNQPNK